MKSQRHPHPHVDPRTPRDRAVCGTNPPVFAWRPAAEGRRFTLTVARDESFARPVIDLADLVEPSHLPTGALEPGAYFWKWSDGENSGQVFRFEIPADAAIVEVPPAAEWLRRFPTEHPRIYIRPEDVAALRASCAGEREALWKRLEAAAEKLLDEPHEIEEPPFLPDRHLDYKKNFDVWHGILRESREFVRKALHLALAYLAGGETKYARAACRRMASISRWDPYGSSHIDHNDEAHMSVIWDGPQVVDWVWEQFTDDERALVIDQFRKRGEINFEHMHNRGSYGITRFDSHAGREIVFLAQLAFVFHEEIPEAAKWLEWLRPVLCGLWPSWSGDDGGWGQGPNYGLAYVHIMQMFVLTLKRGAGVDLFGRPFWRGHAHWRRWCVPPYVQWMGFSDQTTAGAGIFRRNADLVELIARELGTHEFDEYVGRLRAEADREAGPVSGAPDPMRFLSQPLPPADRPPPEDGKVLRIFEDTGLAAFRTDLEDPASDVALLFRSSPYGSISHSHASNNDFILHVAGKVLVMPAGFYDGYGSAHHCHYVWETRSHNCVTLSGAGQLIQSHDAVGRVSGGFEDERLASLCGVADASYGPLAERCRRHVLYLKAHRCFLLVDDFVAGARVRAGLEWHIHSQAPFAADEEARTFHVEREGSTLEGHVLFHRTSFFTLTQGWDPPPMEQPATRKLAFPMQYHLRFTPSEMPAHRTLAVLLCPGHANLRPAKVEAELVGDTEVARLEDDRILVRSRGTIDAEDVTSDALAVLLLDGTRYELGEAGITT